MHPRHRTVREYQNTSNCWHVVEKRNIYLNLHGGLDSGVQETVTTITVDEILNREGSFDRGFRGANGEKSNSYVDNFAFTTIVHPKIARIKIINSIGLFNRFNTVVRLWKGVAPVSNAMSCCCSTVDMTCGKRCELVLL